MIREDVRQSNEFKAQTKRAIAAIFIFGLVYLIILGLAVTLTVTGILGGISIITSYPHFVTLLLGVGLASLGVLILIFLLKFLFKFKKTDRSHLIEVTAQEEPELFKMIDDIVTEVGTKFPKKVY